MDDYVIEAVNVSKKYKIVHLDRSGFNTLRDKIGGAIVHPIKFFKSLKHNKPEDFLALQGLNFSIKSGEIVGIIGGNGAGKSTLLKVLSGITPPSTGKIKIVGQVTSILEVGTGFHPELSGRENIFLNGAILGMPKVEIIKKFDEIVEFAGVAKFIDTPVKRYSSGMYSRLAFAVAAHMDNDILFIDEVLAVGDSEFQNKCLGKIDQLVREKKKTILFVSHNLPSIKALCPRSILLVNGQIAEDGPTTEVIEKYLQLKGSPAFARQLDTSTSSQLIRLEAVSITDEVGQSVHSFDCDHQVIINFTCTATDSLDNITGCLTVRANDGTIVLESFSDDYSPNPINNLGPIRANFSLALPARSLAAGHYNVYLSFFQELSNDNPEAIFVGTFELSDPTTSKGNDRNGFFSAIIDWKQLS